MSEYPHPHMAYMEQRQADEGKATEHLHRELLSRYWNDCIVPSWFITTLWAWLQPIQRARGDSPSSLAACAAQVLTATRDTCHGTGLLQQRW